MRFVSVLLAAIISIPFSPGAVAQTVAPALNILVLEGEGAINNIKQRTSRETIVQVEDENHKPVAGAVVVFTLPSQGPGGTVGGAAQTVTTTTNAQGQAALKGFRPNNVEGQYQIRVTASKNGQSANATITQTNSLLAAGAVGAAHAGISGKLIAIIAIAGAAAAGGALYATQRGGGSNSTTTIPTISISPGTGTVGAPR
jgi:hypothetical protein